MTSTLTFPDLPADHPLNTGKGIISVHGSEVLTDPELLIHPAKPPVNKRYRSGRTCKNCILYHCRSDFKAGCCYHERGDRRSSPLLLRGRRHEADTPNPRRAPNRRHRLRNGRLRGRLLSRRGERGYHGRPYPHRPWQAHSALRDRPLLRAVLSFLPL